MNDHVFTPSAPGADDEVRTLLTYTLMDIVRLAHRLGYVVTVEQVSQQPPAMGNYTTRVDLRPRRAKGGA